MKYSCSMPPPFPAKSVGVLLIILGNSRKVTEEMEVELLQDAVDRIGLSVVPVGTIECGTRSLHRQRHHLESLAVSRDGGNARGDTKINVAEDRVRVTLTNRGWPAAPPLGFGSDAAGI